MSSPAEISRECTANFIRHSINPVIAVLASYEAEMVCQKNSLSFCELLAPFNKLTSDVAFKDPSNQSHLVKSLTLDFRDLRRDGFLTTNALPLALTELVRSVPFAAESSSYETEEQCAEVTPWYEQYRKQFTKLLEPSDHEFIRNYIACILVVSTSHSDPLDQLTRLSQTQHVLQHQLGSSSAGRSSEQLNLPKHAAHPKWFSPNIFKFHVLLHDVSSDDEKKAEPVYQSMKMTYGAHACHLLRINSNLPSSFADDLNTPDPWAGYLKNTLRHFDSVRIDTTHKQSYSEETVMPTLESTTGLPHASSLVDLTTSMNVDVPLENSLVDIQPQVVRSESIPHPLSSADLSSLAPNEATDGYQLENATDIKHGRHLSSTDVDRIKIFVQELCLRGLLPFVERQLKLLNDQISSRRGLISKSLVSSAKRWFTSGSSPNLPLIASNTALSPDKSPSFRPQQPLVSYAAESVEMQMRRLADLAFLFQHYDLAYQHYYALKKEFAHTGAWLHQASAAEFASLCVYLSGPTTSTPYPSHYMDMALTSYSSMCEKPWLAVRATIFGAEILISQCTQSSYSEAAGLYIRMTTGDDLSGALFLERAAWCFAKAKLFRKAALHLILAGHRFRKSGLNNHTSRCYELAYVSYQFRGWSFADDHIKFTLSNHCRNLIDQTNSTEISELTEIFLKLKRYCFSNDYLSNTKQLTNLVASAISKKPLPLGLIVKDGYHYGFKQTTVSSYSLAEDTRRISSKQSLSPDVFSSRLNCPSTLLHDFHKSSLCYIPVRLTLFNHHTGSNLKVVVKMFTGSQSFSDFTSKGQVCQPITWTHSSLRVTRLKPNESKVINLMGYTTYPGVYDVGNLWLKFSQDELNEEFETKLQSHFVTLRQIEIR